MKFSKCSVFDYHIYSSKVTNSYDPYSRVSYKSMNNKFSVIQETDHTYIYLLLNQESYFETKILFILLKITNIFKKIKYHAFRAILKFIIIYYWDSFHGVNYSLIISLIYSCLKWDRLMNFEIILLNVTNLFALFCYINKYFI